MNSIAASNLRMPPKRVRCVEPFLMSSTQQRLCGDRRRAEQIALAHCVLLAVLGDAQARMERRVGRVRINLMREEPLAVRATVAVEHERLQALAEPLLIDELVNLLVICGKVLGQEKTLPENEGKGPKAPRSQSSRASET